MAFALCGYTDCIHAESVQQVDIAELATASVPAILCRMLGAAPECYREFRLYTTGHASHEIGDMVRDAALIIQAQSQSFADENVALRMFDSLQAVSAAMGLTAGAHGLTVSVSDDGTHVLLTRVKSLPASERLAVRVLNL